MKTSIEFLPEHKQQELRNLVAIICERYEVEMIILFGSFARNQWVEELEDDGIHYKYQSDFDIFVVTKTSSMADKIEIDNKLYDVIDSAIKTPVAIIAHNIDFFNKRLRKGQYFFSDIKKEGICLYDSGRAELAEEKMLSPKEYKKLAEKDFAEWFTKGSEFLIDVDNCFERGSYKKAAFELHQSAENFYSALLLVLTRYKPKTHDLKKLSIYAGGIVSEILNVFPKMTNEEKYRFELLRRAYVDARYNPKYEITKEDLMWLRDRVKILQEKTREICQNKIANFLI